MGKKTKKDAPEIKANPDDGPDEERYYEEDGAKGVDESELTIKLESSVNKPALPQYDPKYAVEALESLLQSDDEGIKLQAAQTLLVHARGY
jgi:hypothetical protein